MGCIFLNKLFIVKNQYQHINANYTSVSVTKHYILYYSYTHYQTSLESLSVSFSFVLLWTRSLNVYIPIQEQQAGE